MQAISGTVAGIVLLLLAASPATAQPVAAGAPPMVAGIKFPNRFLSAWWLEIWAGGRPYLQCDYTTKTCDRGVAHEGKRGIVFVGAVVPDDNRDHVLQNISCSYQGCTDYGTGAFYIAGRGDTPGYYLKEDLPESCVIEAREHGRRFY